MNRIMNSIIKEITKCRVLLAALGLALLLFTPSRGTALIPALMYKEFSAAPAATGTGVFSVNRATSTGNGGGETVTVTTLEDVSDFSGLQQVSDLPGPDGRVSFREAVAAANNTLGPQTIHFAISTAEFWLVPDVALLKLEQGAFFLNDSGTTVDFSTQTTNIGNTNPNGPEVGIYGLEPNGWGIAAIFLNGNNCVVRGLGKVYQRGYAVRIVGNDNRVIGCLIDGPLHAAVSVEGYLGWPAPSGNIVGGTEPGEGNILTGVVINGPAQGNIVIGNPLIVGVRVQGATRYGVIARDNRIGGPNPAERNVISGVGGYGEEGFPIGSQVSVVDADGTIVEGNYIGTTADGMARYPQQLGPVGVEVYDSRGTTIRGNLIAGLRTVGVNHFNGQIFGQAIQVGATNLDTYDTIIESNSIGLAADGVTPIVTRSGVTVSPLSGSHHALGTRITSNHIASVETTGVVVGSQENGVTISGNSIHDCGGLGIDLLSGSFAGFGGVTPNDPGDGDTGGNGLQNFPVLLSAAPSSSGVTIQGTLDSSPNVQFAVEFFTSGSCDPSGFGEGAALIGSTLVTTDGAGYAAFSVTLPATAPFGTTVTATATHLSSGATSEFSACIAVTSNVPPIAKASAMPTSGTEPLTVQFSSAGSSDPDGTIASYSWNFGDDGDSSAANPSYTYSSAGSYTATLTVTDNNDSSASASVTINVSPAVKLRLRSTAINLSATLHGKKVSVTANVVVKDADGAAVSGAVVSARWANPSGGTVTQAATTNSTGLAKFNTTGGRGTYTLTVTNISKTGYTFDAVNSVLSKSITK